MELQEVADKIGVSKRTLENRLRRLNETERNSIRNETKIGNVRKFIYNDEALKVLANGVSIRTLPKNTTPPSSFTELEHYKILYKNSLKRIDELKEEISDLKQEKKEEVKELKNDNKEQSTRFNEAIKYFEGLVTDTQNLMSQQQKLHYKEMDKRSLQTPVKKSKFNIFRRNEE